MIEVKLPSGVHQAAKLWDLAHALGAAALARWPKMQSARVRAHHNRHNLITWARRGTQLRLGVHVAFLPHPDDVLAVVDRRDPQAWERLLALPREARAPRLTTAGSVHDLDELLSVEAARAEVHEVGEVMVGWGRWPGRMPWKSLRLGSCQQGPPRVIRIHPCLDHEEVPSWFVGFVLYHELLHLRFPPITEGGRRVVHPRSFRMAERRHPGWRRASEWEANHLTELLRRVRMQVVARRYQ